jgi:hypothetical protein
VRTIRLLVHISNTPMELIDYTQANDMLVEAYSPVAHGELLKNEEIKPMAERYGVTIPQLSIRYDLQLGLLPLPKTENPEHMKSNADVDFEISDEDLEILRNVEPISDYGQAGECQCSEEGRSRIELATVRLAFSSHQVKRAWLDSNQQWTGPDSAGCLSMHGVPVSASGSLRTPPISVNTASQVK